MIALSPRYALIMTLLLLGPAAASLYHLTAAPRFETCADPSALMAEDFLPDLYDAHPVTGQTGDFVDMSNGRVAIFGPGKRSPEWRIVRSYEKFQYYFVPRRMFNPIYGDDHAEIRTLEIGDTRVPLHVRIHLDRNSRRERFTAYYFVQGGEPVGNPFTGSIARALPQLSHGPDSLTVFILAGVWPEERGEERQGLAMEWLRKTWDRYEAVCNPASGDGPASPRRSPEGKIPSVRANAGSESG